MSSNDEKFMYQAFLEAKKAFAINEVPVGAVLVFQNKIFSRAHNLVEKTQDASFHAELQCLQKAAKKWKQWRLLETTLYCTLEPCCMCAGAMTLFRIKRLVYGAKDFRYGANGTVFSVLNQPHPIHQFEITEGIFAEESKGIMEDFFCQRRKKSGKNIRAAHCSARG